MAMKIENYETFKTGISADTFTFPHNPNVFDDDIKKFFDQQDNPYAYTYVGVTNPLKSSRDLALNGHFDDATSADKSSDYQELAKHGNDNKLKKLYFSSDKFYIGLFRGPKKTNEGGRTAFIDYVARFFSPVGILFGDTQKSDTLDDGDTSTQVTMTTGGKTNDGNVATPIEKVEGDVSSGANVIFKDKDGNGWEIASTSTDGRLTVHFIYFKDQGNGSFFTNYIYAEIDGTEQVVKNADTSGQMTITLDPNESLDDLFEDASAEISGFDVDTFGTGEDVRIKFRDGYSGE